MSHQQSSIGWAFGNSSAAEPVQSSNKYANGSNQNCGNVITGRPSTRVHAAPGGNSSISFGSESVRQFDQKKKVVAPTNTASKSEAVTFGARNSKTSSNSYACGANQNCGNVITGRSSTRVHAPPGGKSQISFGSYEAPKSAALKDTTTPQNATTQAASVIKKGVSSNRFASGSNQNCGNVITDRSTTRIHAPPGGRSSITFG